MIALAIPDESSLGQLSRFAVFDFESHRVGALCGSISVYGDDIARCLKRPTLDIVENMVRLQCEEVVGHENRALGAG